MAIQLDITPHEIRYRLIDPTKVTVVGRSRQHLPKGISMVIACPVKLRKNRCPVGTKVQALRFERDRFTPAQAANWIKKHWRK